VGIGSFVMLDGCLVWGLGWFAFGSYGVGTMVKVGKTSVEMRYFIWLVCGGVFWVLLGLCVRLWRVESFH
jgi:hypothetical protein